MPNNFFKKSKYFFSKKNNPRIPEFYSSNRCKNSLEIYPEIPEFFQVSFIDPGTTSCGFRIVRYYLENFSMQLIWFSIINFGQTTQKINENMESTMSIVSEYLKDCHHIAIESQLMKCKTTYQCHAAVIYYITTQICPKQMNPILIEIDCCIKTSFLGGPRTKRENNSYEMKEYVRLKHLKRTGENIIPKNGTIEIKEWTKMKSREFSIERRDFISYHILENSLYKTNEDLSDTVCYEYAWISYILTRNDIFTPFDKRILK